MSPVIYIWGMILITVSDIYVRYQRMKKQNVLWQMGTDHAGIATQIVVSENVSVKVLIQKLVENALDQERVG